jgi:two-component system CheB/CheR fusion protein
MPKDPPSSDPANEARLEAVLESVNDSFYALDTAWRYVVFNRAAEEYFGVTRDVLLGRKLWDVFPQGLGTPFEGHCRAAMDEGVSTTLETPSRMRPDRIVELRIVPMRGGGVAVSLSDITERKEAEARQRLLVNELNHRVKNALATVQAIATHSLGGPDVAVEARERFTARLVALARANDVLVAETWRGAGLATIAGLAASPYTDAADPERFRTRGPAVQLSPKAATAMALALHELATNAAKYGALSTRNGQVDLGWALEGDGADRRFRMIWRETGGPAVTTPARTGFGGRLIDRGLRAALNAEVALDYAVDGLVLTLSAPLGEAVSERRG